MDSVELSHLAELRESPVLAMDPTTMGLHLSAQRSRQRRMHIGVKANGLVRHHTSIITDESSLVSPARIDRRTESAGRPQNLFPAISRSEHLDSLRP